MAANTLDPNILSILAAARGAGGAPYKPVGPTGSPFIRGGGTPFTPAPAPNAGGGMSFGSMGQWALPRPAGVSLGYIPTPQVIGSPKNAYVPKTLESFIPPKPVTTETEKKKSVISKPKFRETSSGRADKSYTTSEPGSQANRSGSSAYGGYGKTGGGLY